MGCSIVLVCRGSNRGMPLRAGPAAAASCARGPAADQRGDGAWALSSTAGGATTQAVVPSTCATTGRVEGRGPAGGGGEERGIAEPLLQTFAQAAAARGRRHRRRGHRISGGDEIAMLEEA